MSTNKDITLYLDNRNPPPVVTVSQGDTDWLYRFTVMYNNAVYSPSVTYVILTGRKPDGHVFAYRGAKSGNLYTVTPANANGNLVQMTAVAGDVPCELRLISGGRSVGTANFILRVEPGPEGVVTVASASALPAYTTILQELGVLIGKVETLPDDVPGWIGDWLEEHISGGQGVAVDNTLTVQGAAADAKETGGRFAALTTVMAGKLSTDGSDTLTDTQKAAIRAAIGAEAVGNGLSADVKTALLACFENVEWPQAGGRVFYTALYNALYPDSPIIPPSSDYTFYNYIFRTSDYGTQGTRDFGSLLATRSFSDLNQIIIDFDFMPKVAKSAATGLLGYNAAASGNNDCIAFFSRTDTKRVSVFSRGTALGLDQLSDVAVNKIAHVRLNPGSASPSTLTVGSNSVTGAWTVEKTLPGPLCYFGQQNSVNQTYSPYSFAAIGTLTISNLAGIAVARYVPAVRNADGVIGIYDELSGDFETTQDPDYATQGNAKCVLAVGNWG